MHERFVVVAAACSRMERAGKPRHRWATREGERAGGNESTLSECKPRNLRREDGQCAHRGE